MYLLLYSSIKYLFFWKINLFLFISNSVTIQNVQDQSHNLWRYQRFLIVNEFRNKSLLPPPFNTFYCFFSAIIRFIKRYRKRYRSHAPGKYIL